MTSFEPNQGLRATNNNQPNNSMTAAQFERRNLSIIAHVDHGKTTLSDSLLQRAGMLSKQRAGQACALDSSDIEKEKGITIHSSAVSLDFPLSNELVQQLHETLNQQDVDGGGTVQEISCSSEEEEHLTGEAVIYIGNLPFGVTRDELVAFLCDQGVSEGSVRIDSVSSKRGYGFLTALSSSTASQILSLNQTEWQGRAVVVECKGESPLLILRRYCSSQGRLGDRTTFHDFTSLQRQGWQGITMCVTESNGKRYMRLALPNGLGQVQVILAESTTLKQGKQQVAERALKYLESLGHCSSPSLRVSDDGGDSDETTEPIQPNSGDCDLSTLRCNVIDCPGHVEFNSEVSASLRVSDGALVIVDASEGVCVQTDTVLRQALQERVRPILLLNKVDRLIIELQLDPKAIFQQFQRVIAAVNGIISDCGFGEDAEFDWRVSIEHGTVSFGSGYFGWVMSMRDIVLRLVERVDESSHSHLSKSERCAKLRREVFSSKHLESNLCKLVLRPLVNIHRACMDEHWAEIPSFIHSEEGSEQSPPLVERFRNILKRQCVDLSDVSRSEWESFSKNKDLLKMVMRHWSPAAMSLVHSFALHLPSPSTAQRYRAQVLVASESVTFEHVRACSSEGPLVLFISKLVPLSNPKGTGKAPELAAIGRVYSGSVGVGESVKVMCCAGEAKVKRLVRFGGKRGWVTESRGVAGDIIGLVGLDNVLVKAATLTTAAQGEELTPFKAIDMKVQAVVKVAVSSVRSDHLSKLKTALKTLTQIDPCASLETDGESNEMVLGAGGELHLEVLLASLRQMLHQSVQIKVSEPRISFRETVDGVSACEVLVKTANKLNRFYFTASQLPPALVKMMEAGEIGPGTDSLKRSQVLVKRFGWDKNHAQRIWAYGPEGAQPPTCVLVNSTVGVNGLEGVTGDMSVAFQQLCRSAGLMGERLHGVRFDLVDAKIHSDAAHRRTAQVLPASIRGMKAAFLLAGPRVLEPTLRVVTRVPQDVIGSVYDVMCSFPGGQVLCHEVTDAGDVIVQSRVPLVTSSGITDAIRGATAGKAFPQISFDGFEPVPGDPLSDDSNRSAELVQKIRISKNMPEVVESGHSLMDKL